VEQVALADDARQISVFIDDRQVPDAAEPHHIVGHRELFVALERGHFFGHDVSDEQCFRIHDLPVSMPRACSGLVRCPGYRLECGASMDRESKLEQ
jgi:hypothetical protein